MLGAFCLTEPQAGSDAAHLKTRAERGRPLGAERQQAVHHLGQNAGIAIVFAVTDPAPASVASALSSCPPTRRAIAWPRRKKARPARFRHLRRSCSRTATCRRRTCSARRARATHRARQPRGRPHRHRRASGRHGARRVRGGARLRQASATFGKPIIEHQAVAVPPGRHGDQDRRGAADDAARGAPADAGLPCLTEASMAKLFASRNGREGLLGRDPDPRRLRLLAISRSSASIATCACARSTKAPATSSASSSAVAWRFYRLRPPFACSRVGLVQNSAGVNKTAKAVLGTGGARATDGRSCTVEI